MQSYHLMGTPVAPGADAELGVEAKEGNQEITLQVKHLLPPGRVQPGARHYAVWVTPPKRSAVHLGNLDYNDKDGVGELVAVTPHRRFLFRVTAESSETPRKPRGPVVLREEVAAH